MKDQWTNKFTNFYIAGYFLLILLRVDAKLIITKLLLYFPLVFKEKDRGKNAQITGIVSLKRF